MVCYTDDQGNLFASCRFNDACGIEFDSCLDVAMTAIAKAQVEISPLPGVDVEN